MPKMISSYRANFELKCRENRTPIETLQKSHSRKKCLSHPGHSLPPEIREGSLVKRQRTSRQGLDSSIQRSETDSPFKTAVVVTLLKSAQT